MNTSTTLTKAPTLPAGKPPPEAKSPSAPSASEKRAQHPLFVAMFAIQNLLTKLPLLFPVPSDLPPSPKTTYRSHYCYPGPDALREKDRRTLLSDFEVALYLIDFSPLERLLAQFYLPSHKGQVPFHPVSMFLAICLRRELHCSWRKLAKLLAGEHGAGWRKLFGFIEGQAPSASGLRYFFRTVGSGLFDELCPKFVDLLRQHDIFPERSTYPGDNNNNNEDRGITMTQDGSFILLSRDLVANLLLIVATSP